MAILKEGGKFETFNDVKGNPLVSINRDGTVSAIGIDFADGTKQTTAASGGGGTPGTPVNSVQGNKAGTFAGLLGSVIDFVNGLLSLAPTGIGVALTIKGDPSASSDILRVIPSTQTDAIVSVGRDGNLVAGTSDYVGPNDGTTPTLQVAGDLSGDPIAIFAINNGGDISTNALFIDAQGNVFVAQKDLIVGNGALIIEFASTKSSGTDAGQSGQIAWDTGFLYICTNTGSAGEATWKKVALVDAP